MLRFFTILICVLLLAGCRSGGGGSGGPLDNYTFGGSQESDILVATTPEPSTLLLFGIGLGALAAKKLIERKKH